MSEDQLSSDKRKINWVVKSKTKASMRKTHRHHFCLLELNLSEISALFSPPLLLFLPLFDVKLTGRAAHSWMWPTHQTLKTHVESLLPVPSCVTLADYIYVAIFRRRWPRPAYYATKHALFFFPLS